MMKKQISVLMLLLGSILLLSQQADAQKISSPQQAKKLAQAKVGTSHFTEVSMDTEAGVSVYEVELIKGNKEYTLSYQISNGKLLKYQWELQTHSTANYPGSKKLTQKKIRQIAKKKVPGAAIQSLYLNDPDDYDMEYKVILKKGTKTYTLEINAYNGKLEEYQWKCSAKQTSSSKYIGTKKAKSIASAKVPGATIVKIEFDNDDGRPVYEVEMRDGAMEYDLTIDARSGKILEYESDMDD